METSVCIAMNNGALLRLTLHERDTQAQLLRCDADCAHLFSGTGYAMLPLDSGRGALPRRFQADAAILTRGGRAICWGGFAGDHARFERAMLTLHVRPAGQAAPAEQTERRIEAPRIAPSVSEAKPPESEPPPLPAAPASTIADGAPGQSTALYEILQRAQKLFEQPAAPEQPATPYIIELPAVIWRKVEYPGTGRWYFEGRLSRGGADYLLHALPGTPGKSPGRGFNRFCRAADGSGWWVRVRTVKR